MKGFKLFETVRLILARGFAAGIVWMLIFLIASPNNMPFYVPLMYPLFIPLLALALFPVFLLLEVFNYGWIAGILTLITSLPGDPILFFLRTKLPYWIPVDKYNIFQFSSYIMVYDDILPQTNEVNNSVNSANGTTMIYDSSFGGSIIGRLESDGLVYNSSFGGSCIGKVDASGFVYNSSFGGSLLARVQSDGKVFSGNFGGNLLGSVDSNGSIHTPNLMGAGEIIAKAEGSNVYGAGAAYLALFKG